MSGFNRNNISCNHSLLSFNGWGVTIVDSLDTMLLMGLDQQFNSAIANISTLDFTMPLVGVCYYHAIKIIHMSAGKASTLLRNNHTLYWRLPFSVCIFQRNYPSVPCRTVGDSTLTCIQDTERSSSL